MQRDSSWWPCASGPRVGIGSCPLCLVTRVLGHIHRGEALGAFHGAGTSSHPVTLAWDGPWQGRLRWPAGSARGLAGGPRCKSSGTAGEEWRRAQHRRERGPGPWSTVRTEPPTSVNRQTAPARLLARRSRLRAVGTTVGSRRLVSDGGSAGRSGDATREPVSAGTARSRGQGWDWSFLVPSAARAVPGCAGPGEVMGSPGGGWPGTAVTPAVGLLRGSCEGAVAPGVTAVISPTQTCGPWTSWRRRSPRTAPRAGSAWRGSKALWACSSRPPPRTP